MIEFPNLWGLNFTINNVAFNLFGINIYWYGIIIAVGFALAVFLGMRACKDFGIKSDDIIDLVIFAVPVSIIFARAYYVIFSWDQFKDAPLTMFNPRTGGLAIYGGLIGALLTAFLFAKYKKIPLFKLLDFGMPYFVLAQAVGRWGNFVNQEAYGTQTDLPWGMIGDRIMDGPVHPTFLYESLWNLGVFFLLIWFRKRKKVEGEVFFLYMMLYGFGRFWIEPMRTDSLWLGNFRISQVLAGIFVIAFAIVLYIRRKKVANAIEEATEVVPSKYASVLDKLKEEKTVDETVESIETEKEEVSSEDNLSTEEKEAPVEGADSKE